METKSFTCTIEDKECELIVKTPALDDQREAQKVYNQAFTDAIKSKSVVRARLDDLLKEQGLWDDQKQIKFDTIQREISDNEARLAKGGFGLKEAKELAISIRDLRAQLRDLISVRTSLDNHSAEGQADNARFNYLVSACVVYKNDKTKKVFKNMEDYLNRANEEVAILGAQHLANMIYGLDNDYENNLPENKFLKKYKFVDKDLRFINKEGQYVDKDGKLVDKDGRYINEDGEYIDKYGNRVDADGEYVSEFSPFLDEDGNPVIVDDQEESKAEATEPVKKTTAKSKKSKDKDEESSEDVESKQAKEDS